MKRKKVIESGWKEYRQKVIPRDAPRIQLDESRRAFYAGAHHLWVSMMTMMTPADEASEPTPEDHALAGGIQQEFDDFLEELSIRLGGPSRN